MVRIMKLGEQAVLARNRPVGSKSPLFVIRHIRICLHQTHRGQEEDEQKSATRVVDLIL